MNRNVCDKVESTNVYVSRWYSIFIFYGINFISSLIWWSYPLICILLMLKQTFEILHVAIGNTLAIKVLHIFLSHTFIRCIRRWKWWCSTAMMYSLSPFQSIEQISSTHACTHPHHADAIGIRKFLQSHNVHSIIESFYNFATHYVCLPLGIGSQITSINLAVSTLPRA